MRELLVLGAGLIVVAVLALGVVGAISFFTTSANATNQIADVALFANGLQGQAANAGYIYPTGTIAPTQLINAGIVPAADIPAGSPGVVNTRFGSAITFTGATNQFSIGLPGIPAKVCVAMLISTLLPTSLASVTVNSGTALAPPVPAATASTTCGTAADQLTFTFNGQPS